MAPGDLPAQLTPFIGRTDEIAAIVDRLDDPYCRLLTLVGPGGVGKTRLAIEVASRQFHSFADGVYFAGLQPIASINHIVPAVASAVGFEFYDGRNPTAQLLHFLCDKHLFLILDNFEHLLPATDVVTELLTGAPQLKLLVTSRAALNLREEWLFRVEGMSYPQDESADILDAYSAVQLFAERAQRARHDFSLADEAAHVVRVCQLVDGMPLGIELAATWLRRLPCPAIVQEIQHSLDILATDLHGIPDRHRSMRAVFDHSWKLLDEEERQALMGLSVFRGGCSRQAAEQVTGATLHTLSALVDKSMLWFTSDGRYEVHELERQYAEERLDEMPQEKVGVRDRHCGYYLEFMCQPERNFIGAANKKTLHAIDTEIDNVRVAWNWAVERKQASNLKKAMYGLYWFSWLRSWHEEGERAFRRAVEALRDAELSVESEIALGDALNKLGAMCIWLGRGQEALEHIKESESILRRLDARRELARAIGNQGWFAVAQQDWEVAKPLLEEAATLAERTGQREYQGFMMSLLGGVSASLGDYENAEDWHRQALLLGKRIGDQRTVADALLALGGLAQRRGQYLTARQLYKEGLAVAQAAEIAVFTIGAFQKLGSIAEVMGELDIARDHLEASQLKGA